MEKEITFKYGTVPFTRSFVEELLTTYYEQGAIPGLGHKVMKKKTEKKIPN